jgi:L-gulonate 5-dehydrogenase
MKAIVFHAPKMISIEDVPIPEIKGNEALIKVVQVGICGGDIHFYDGSQPYANYPQIYGHEVVGRIEKLPEDAGCDFKIGDLVVAEILSPCGTCYPCRHGKPNCCANLKVIGAHTQGAFAEFAVYPINNLHKVPDNVSIDAAVLTEPYTIGYHCVERSEIVSGETALVIGAGAIGLTIVDILKTRGVHVVAADLSEYRLGKALGMGADVVINSSKEDLMARVMELTNGEGAGVVFEATGVSSIMSMTQDLVAAGGVIVIVGLTTKDVSFHGLNFTKREMTIHGSRNSVGAFGPVLRLMSEGKLHEKELLTRKIAFDDAVEGFRYVADNLATEGKVVIVVNE